MKTSTILILATAMVGCGDLEDENNDDIEVVQSAITQTERCAAIDAKRAANAFLGAEDGGGCRFFTNGAAKFYQGGTIFFGDSVPAPQAHVVHGLIAAKYLAMGAQASVLKYPTTDERDPRFFGGRFNLFQGGLILWKSGAAQAREIHGANLTLFNGLSGEWGNMGWPTSDEFVLTGRKKNDFEFGKIYSRSGGAWPTLTSSSTVSRLFETNSPRITSVTMSGTGSGTFLSATAEKFTPGRSATLRLTHPDNGAIWSTGATVDANGRLTFPSKFVENNFIPKIFGLATVWVYQDDNHQAVIGKLTAAGFNYNGQL